MTETAPHQAIYRRWRAQTFDQIVGQGAVVQTLRNAVRTGRVSHAILFVGPRGTGKTSLARILAKAINCTDLRDGDPCDACPSCVAIREGRALDLVEIDAASNRGIDAIRELRERINYAPADLKRKVYILDEAHQITKDAWNALLKSLEEPPDFVVFMFASTHPQDFPPAILSRLQRFDVRRLSTGEIEGKLVRILEADGRTAEPAALHLIARLAAGGMRDAESMLDQLLASSTDTVDEATVRDLLGLATADAVDGFAAALINGDVAGGVAILGELEDRGRDLRSFLDQVIERLRNGMVGPSGTTDESATGHAAADLVRAARRLASIDPNRVGVGGLRLQLELALFPDPQARPSTAIRVPVRLPAPDASEPALAPRGGSRTSSDRSPAVLGATLGSSLSPSDGTVAARQADAPSASTPRRQGTAARSPSSDAVAPAVASPVATVGAIAVPAGSDLATLRDRWAEVVARVSAHPPTKPLIAVCRPISVEDGIVTLGFPEDQGFLRDVAERRRAVLEDGIAAVLGRQFGVRCVATNLELVPGAPSDADAAFVLAEARRIFGADDPDVGEVH